MEVLVELDDERCRGVGADGTILAIDEALDLGEVMGLPAAQDREQFAQRDRALAVAGEIDRLLAERALWKRCNMAAQDDDGLGGVVLLDGTR